MTVPLSPLLDALASATAGSRELDALIEIARLGNGMRFDFLPSVVSTPWGSHYAPLYTTSHDAARTLLLPDWRVRCMFQAYADGPCDVELADLGTVLHSNHRDPILAICIAALKARGIGGGV